MKELHISIYIDCDDIKMECKEDCLNYVDTPCVIINLKQITQYDCNLRKFHMKILKWCDGRNQQDNAVFKFKFTQAQIVIGISRMCQESRHATTTLGMPQLCPNNFGYNDGLMEQKN